MKRTLPGILIAVAWVLLLLAGTPIHFYLVMLCVVAIAAYEYLKMTFKEGLGIFSRAFLILTLGLPTVFAWPGCQYISSQFGLYLSFFLTTLYFIKRYAHFDDTYERFSRVVFGIVYVGVLASYLVMLRYIPQGGSWLVVLSAITAGSDSGAYYFGRTFGKRKLSPHISPKKTVEGALGGLLSSVIIAILFSWILLDNVNMFLVVGIAILLTGVGILGDLAESIIKRGTSTKDSGRLLAGHGGVLDRIDSILLASPVLYYLLIIIGV
ncbi:phosphatidate cytidylyltransferase [Desulfosediminicola flagellatus]|uniref:phosphatidate cytidylyltransferase n=1 Tax=Desulfosediminicola flagellatus TaxID=2569541 RepID=UPI0010ABC4A4|nr:phosphatidate cytidylyltransferase [Desulfosediminicola flagellatus]